MTTPEQPQRFSRVLYLRGRSDKKLHATIPLDPATPVLDALSEHLQARPRVLRVLEVVEVDEAGNEVTAEPPAGPVEELDPLVAELDAAIDDSREKEAAAAAARERERQLRQQRDELIRRLAPGTTQERLGRRFKLSAAQISRIVSAQETRDS